jgi:hypothetical protein
VSLSKVAATPCWELSHHEHDDWVPHFATHTEALAALAADEDRDASSQPRQRARVCVRLLCNACLNEVGMDGDMTEEGDGIHIDPADLNGWLTEWHVLDDNRHQCPSCPPDEPVLSRIPGPNDLPLIGVPA